MRSDNSAPGIVLHVHVASRPSIVVSLFAGILRICTNRHKQVVYINPLKC